MRVHGKLVIVPNKSDGNCITAAFRWCLRMADPIPLLACLLMFAVRVNACATALILHCNVTSPIFSRFALSLCQLPLLTYMYIYIYTRSPRLFDRYARWIAQWNRRTRETRCVLWRIEIRSKMFRNFVFVILFYSIMKN